MSDNIQLNLATSVGASVRTIEISSAHHQVIMSSPAVLSARTGLTTTQTNQILITQGTGGKLAITQVHVTAANANNTSPAIIIGLGTATVPTTSGVVYSHPGFPSGFTDSRGEGFGFLAVGSEGQDLRMSMDADAAIDVIVSYIVLPV